VCQSLIEEFYSSGLPGGHADFFLLKVGTERQR